MHILAVCDGFITHSGFLTGLVTDVPLYIMDSPVIVSRDMFMNVPVWYVYPSVSFASLSLAVSSTLPWPLTGLGFNPCVSLYTVSLIKNNEMFTPFAFSSMTKQLIINAIISRCLYGCYFANYTRQFV